MKLLRTQRRLSASLLKCSGKRVVFDPDRLEDIQEAITKVDLKELMKEKAIKKTPARGISRGRARKRDSQRKKGRQRGHGTRKGKKNARESVKTVWINNVRTQRELLKILRDKKLVTGKDFREMYQKVKGGFFRSKRHIKLYLNERGIIK